MNKSETLLAVAAELERIGSSGTSLQDVHKSIDELFCGRSSAFVYDCAAIMWLGRGGAAEGDFSVARAAVKYLPNPAIALAQMVTDCTASPDRFRRGVEQLAGPDLLLVADEV